MISNLPVPKSNLVIPGVEPKDKVKEEKSDLNESDSGN